MDQENNHSPPGVSETAGSAAPGDASATPSPPPDQDAAAAAADQARLMEKARQVVYQTPEVRPGKVARLKEAVEEGAYEVDARKVANRIITEELLRKR